MVKRQVINTARTSAPSPLLLALVLGMGFCTTQAADLPAAGATSDGQNAATSQQRISTQCQPNSAAQQALDTMLRAYERGDVAFFQRHLDTSMIGYGLFINDIMTDQNVQRQTRVHVLDRQMQCGPDVAVIDFSWEKYFFDSVGYRPVVTRGRGAVLISGLGQGLNGEWRISGLVGDNPFKTSSVGTNASLQATPPSVSVSSVTLPCTTPTVSGLAVATPVTAVTAPFTALGSVCNITGTTLAFACSVSAAGQFGPVTSPTIFPIPNCTVGTSVLISGGGTVNYSVTGSQAFSGAAGSTIPITVPLTISGTGTGGGYTVSSSGVSSCSINATLPTAPPVCTPSAGNLATVIEVRDADQNASAVQVQVLASNGDSENLLLPRVAPGVYQLSTLPITRGAARVSPGSGRIELVGSTATTVTLTLRYYDAKTTSGAPQVRQTTLTLLP